MKLLERLKEIVHFNIHKDENNQNEDENRIKRGESCKDNPKSLFEEGKKPEGRTSNEKKPEDRDIEKENGEETYSDPAQESELEYEIIEREILPEKIICPDCGGITLEGLDFCDKCGGELHIYNR
jgi:hypothetical protein